MIFCSLKTETYSLMGLIDKQKTKEGIVVDQIIVKTYVAPFPGTQWKIFGQLVTDGKRKANGNNHHNLIIAVFNGPGQQKTITIPIGCTPEEAIQRADQEFSNFVQFQYH
mgnify:CR=1 FL=1